MSSVHPLAAACDGTYKGKLGNVVPLEYQPQFKLFWMTDEIPTEFKNADTTYPWSNSKNEEDRNNKFKAYYSLSSAVLNVLEC